MLNKDVPPATFYYKEISHGKEDPKHKLDIIVLHGMGANENDLIPLMEQSGASGHFFFIRSLKQVGPSSFTMFSAQFSAEGPKHNVEEAKYAIDSLKKWIDNKREEGVLRKDAKLAFLGFSQGAIISYALTLKYPDFVDLVIGLNGRVLPEYQAIGPINKNKNKKISIFAFYGIQDQVQPIRFGREAKEKFTKIPWVNYHYHEGNCAHEITNESIAFIQEAFKSLN